MALATGLLGACINPVRSGYPPPVPGCTSTSDCPVPYRCNPDGGCEIQDCAADADCAFEPGLTCQTNMFLPSPSTTTIRQCAVGGGD
jgi:hypothetical protein